MMKTMQVHAPRMGTMDKVTGSPISGEFYHVETPRQPNGAFVAYTSVWADGKEGKAFPADTPDAPAAPDLTTRNAPVSIALTAVFEGGIDNAAYIAAAADYRCKLIQAPGKAYGLQFPVRGSWHGLKDVIAAAARVGKVKSWSVSIEYDDKYNTVVWDALGACQKRADGLGETWQLLYNGTAWTVQATETSVRVRRIAAKNAAWALQLIDDVAAQGRTKKPARNAEKHVARYLDGTAQFQKPSRNK